MKTGVVRDTLLVAGTVAVGQWITSLLFLVAMKTVRFEDGRAYTGAAAILRSIADPWIMTWLPCVVGAVLGGLALGFATRHNSSRPWALGLTAAVAAMVLAPALAYDVFSDNPQKAPLFNFFYFLATSASALLGFSLGRRVKHDATLA